MNHTRLAKKSVFFFILIPVVVLLFEKRPEPARSFTVSDFKENVWIDIDGIEIYQTESRNTTIGDLLTSLRINTAEQDEIWPKPETPLVSGQRITVRHAKTVTLKTSTEKRVVTTFLRTVDQMLAENNIALGENDLVLPGETAPLSDGATIQIIRVTIEEKSIDQPIAFAKQVKEDSKISWRKTIVEQKGIPGIKTLTYRIKTHDGKVMEKKLLKTEITQDPVTEITTQGTYVAVGKTHTGQGTWYAYTGTLAAASPWLPIGSYARVTNRANGKQVIVKINDRGPFGPNRIIDLDKVAFEKIASIGAGVINVKVEEITN